MQTSFLYFVKKAAWQKAGGVDVFRSSGRLQLLHGRPSWVKILPTVFRTRHLVSVGLIITVSCNWFGASSSEDSVTGETARVRVSSSGRPLVEDDFDWPIKAFALYNYPRMK